MPNWCYCNLVVKGSDSSKWLKSGDMTLRSWLPMPKTFEEWDTTNPKLIFEQWFANQIHETNIKITPDIKVKYQKNYEEYSKGYDQAVEFQQTNYGVIGWYQYNLKTLGCKWDVNIDHYECCPNFVQLEFQTPWNPPDAWLDAMCKQYPNLEFIILFEDECMNFCGLIGELTDYIENPSEKDLTELYKQFSNYIHEPIKETGTTENE